MGVLVPNPSIAGGLLECSRTETGHHVVSGDGLGMALSRAFLAIERSTQN
ncbi:hypothetical protein Scep_014122 [Stephania cephalantha]|uniref:Uncharacterized protein n=1 Tax=Stephania cephalantha TaxID=152367 RepID=A0AAP0P2P5_9MAGN